MLQKIENLKTIPMGEVAGATIDCIVGESSEKLQGIIVTETDGAVRRIYFNEIDRIGAIATNMGSISRQQ